MKARVSLFGLVAVTAAALLAPGAADAQGIGIGPRITFASGSEDAVDSQRFIGGALRLGGGKTALEIAMDYRSGVTGDLTERVKDFPIQASLLLFPVRGKIAPYFLAGLGWYSQRVERLGPIDTVLEDETTRKVGYHVGLGGELRLHRHFGFYGDYRYTHIQFGDDDFDPDNSVIPGWIPFGERLKLSHQGSAWTWGANFYF